MSTSTNQPDQIWDQLLLLSREQRTLIAQRLRLFDGGQSASTSDPSLGEAANTLQSELVDAIRATRKYFPPLPIILSSSSKARWLAGVAALNEFLAKVEGFPSRGPRRVKAIRTLVVLLVDHLKAINLPVRPAIVGDALKRIWWILDDAFPGYLEGGVLGKIGD